MKDDAPIAALAVYGTGLHPADVQILDAVISRGLNPAIGNHPNGWTDLQNELAALSSNSLHKTVDGASHQSLAFKQQDAQIVSAIILQVVEAARSGKPMSQL